jgi:hypothetical protein
VITIGYSFFNSSTVYILFSRAPGVVSKYIINYQGSKNNFVKEIIPNPQASLISTSLFNLVRNTPYTVTVTSVYPSGNSYTKTSINLFTTPFF